MSSSVNISDKFRLAIALTILRNKPAGQSLPSYIVELKERFFPSSYPCSESLRSSTSNSTQGHSEWRKRVHALEEENEALKSQIQKQNLDAITGKLGVSLSSSNQPPKKKRTGSSSGKDFISSAMNLKRGLPETLKDIGPGLEPTLVESFDILTSLRLVQQFALARSDISNKATLISSLKRTLRGLGKLVEELTIQPTSQVSASSRFNVACCLKDLLVSTLESGLTFGPRHSILPDILGELTISVIRPIIFGFHSISRRIYTLPSSTKLDVRPNLLCTIKALLDCLRELKERSRDIREFIILEAAKGIIAFWNLSQTEGLSIDKERSEEERSEMIACKDSIWYHCSILQVALSGLAQSAYVEENAQFLSEAAIAAIMELPNIVESRKPVDVLVKNMILAVVEKAWLNGLDSQKPS